MKTYEATATRQGRWWAVEVHGLPRGRVALTQGRTLAEAETMAREAVALVLDVDEGSVEVRLLPRGAEGVVDAVTAARKVREDAANQEQATLAAAAETLTEKAGVSLREAAWLLGLSHQRVSQLLTAASRGVGPVRARRIAKATTSNGQTVLRNASSSLRTTRNPRTGDSATRADAKATKPGRTKRTPAGHS